MPHFVCLTQTNGVPIYFNLNEVSRLYQLGDETPYGKTEVVCTDGHTYHVKEEASTIAGMQSISDHAI